jgi:hypothetical protein
LEFWLALEPLAHEVTCDLCGEKFNVVSQLKDRDWRFRRSGLFGKEDELDGFKRCEKTWIERLNSRPEQRDL